MLYPYLVDLEPTVNENAYRVLFFVFVLTKFSYKFIKKKKKKRLEN